MARLSFGLIAVVTPTLWASFAAAIENDKHNLRALLGSKKPTMVDVVCPAKIISVPEVGWQNLPEAKGCVKVMPTPTTTPTNVCKEVTASSSWLLAPHGATSCCDFGKPVGRDDCQKAVQELADKVDKTPARDLQVFPQVCETCKDGAWGSVPLGCSAQTGYDWTAHYKGSGLNCIAEEFYQLVCFGDPSN
jgi:hypothetical protein